MKVKVGHKKTELCVKKSNTISSVIGISFTPAEYDQMNGQRS